MTKQRYLVVAHGNILNAIMRCVFSIPMPTDGNGSFFKFGDVGYADICYDEQPNRWTLISFYNKNSGGK
jgi:hypothetical protein